MIFDPWNKSEPVAINSREDRHFYGHGAFSPDGRLLYASENDFDGNRGMIGLYDATDRFARIGEFETYGIGPHDMTVSEDGRLLIVANGGIETHPDFGRTKLNLGEMQPSLALIDAATGALVEKHVLLKRNGQNSPPATSISTARAASGSPASMKATARICRRSSAISPRVKISPSSTCRRRRRAKLANYVGAIAVNRSEGLVGITSPKGGASVTLDAKSGKVLAETVVPDAAGIALKRGGFAVSSYDGDFLSTRSDVAWDQHIVRI